MRNMQTADRVDPCTKRSPVIRPQSERAPRYDAKLAVGKIRQGPTGCDRMQQNRTKTRARPRVRTREATAFRFLSRHGLHPGRSGFLELPSP